MKIIGYGICGGGEASRYMKETLDEFARLCDQVVILCNNTGKAEHDLIDSYGFKRVSDRREWGSHQWRIKQDFIERDIKQIANVGDMLVCLDMDEVLDPELTKEWILEAPLDAYKVFVVDLWNDEKHYKPESCFWNVRMWRWNGDTKFKATPLHCGLAPEWAYQYHRFAPFFLKHFGLMLPSDRKLKLARYAKYDPHAQYLDVKYYNMLKSDNAENFDEDDMRRKITKEVESYKQTKPREVFRKPKERFAYVKNPHGEVVDIPARHVDETLRRPGFSMVGWSDEAEKEVESLFEDGAADDLGEERPAGSYQRSAADEQKELKERNQKDDIETGAVDSEEGAESLFADEGEAPPEGTGHAPVVKKPKKKPANKSKKK